MNRVLICVLLIKLFVLPISEAKSQSKIFNIIKFRKNAERTDSIRFGNLIKPIRDSAQYSYRAIDSLLRRTNWDTASLRKFINSIKESSANQNKTTAVPQPSLDSLITTLVNKLTAANQNADADLEDKNKQQTLNFINQVRSNSSPMTGNLALNDTTSYQLKNKTELFGFYDNSIQPGFANADFSPFDGIVYHYLSLDNKGAISFPAASKDTSFFAAVRNNSSAKLYFSILYDQDPFDFLKDPVAQANFLSNVLDVLIKFKGNGINIIFKKINNDNWELFSNFINRLSPPLKTYNQDYKLYITLPSPADENHFFDLSKISSSTEKFFIDFAIYPSLAVQGPIAPLGGKIYTNNIENCISKYASVIPLSRLVIIFPYRGSAWKKSVNGYFFNNYITYRDIRQRSDYSKAVFYDNQSAGAYINDTVNGTKIWFDDENTLGEKYDYILQSGLGGAAVYGINFDGNYQDLKKELVYKFTKIDSNRISKPSFHGPLNLIQTIGHWMYLYGYVLQNPCEVCFEKSKEIATINQYLEDIQIDSLIAKKKKAIRSSGTHDQDQRLWLKDRPDHGVEKFDYVNDKINKDTSYVFWFFAILSLTILFIYISFLKNYGESWKWKKSTERILIGLFILLVCLRSLYLFTNDGFDTFGVHMSEDTVCGYTDPNCVNMRFTIILIIIASGMLLGLVIYHFFIKPLFKREDIP